MVMDHKSALASPFHPYKAFDPFSKKLPLLTIAVEV